MVGQHRSSRWMVRRRCSIGLNRGCDQKFTCTVIAARTWNLVVDSLAVLQILPCYSFRSPGQRLTFRATKGPESKCCHGMRVHDILEQELSNRDAFVANFLVVQDLDRPNSHRWTQKWPINHRSVEVCWSVRLNGSHLSPGPHNRNLSDFWTFVWTT